MNDLLVLILMGLAGCTSTLSVVAIIIARDTLKKVDRALEIKIAPGSYLVVSKSDAK